MPQPKPEHRPDSVRTPRVVPFCPICGTALSGRHTVCSGKCRIARSRQPRAAKQTERDAKVRLLLTEALTLMESLRVGSRRP